MVVGARVRAHGSLAIGTTLCVALLWMHGCELREIPLGTCGNRVQEAGEACDHYTGEESHRCGAPGTRWACQYVCDGSAHYGSTACCPTGTICGLEGLCKRPTGRFAIAAAPLGGGIEELFVGDLDGDHRADLVRLRNEDLSVSFGAPRGELGLVHDQAFEPLFLPVLVERSPSSYGNSAGGAGGAGGAGAAGAAAGAGGATGCTASADLRRADLILPRTGMMSLRADADQNLAPLSLPALPAPEGVDELAVLPVDITSNDQILDLVFHVTIRNPTVGELSALTYISDFAFVPLAPTAGSPSDLSSDPVIAQFDERPESRCRDIVLGYVDREQVELFNPCRQQGAQWVANRCASLLSNCPEDMPRVLDVGAPVARGPLAVDLNGDDHLDLVVQTQLPDDATCAPCFQILAAYGLGDGTFHSDRADLPPASGSGDNSFAIAAELDLDGAAILALGDLDGGGSIDAVTRRAIVVAGGATTVAVNPGKLWTEAHIADFNDNGRQDVVAVNGFSNKVFFYNGAGNGTLNPFEIPTSSPLSQLRLGDFDGDLIGDLLGITTAPRPGDGAALNRVSVLFGSGAGPLDPPVVIGETTQELHLTSGQLASDLLSVLEWIVDGTSDVIAVGKKGEDLNSMHIFIGRGDREMRSAFGLMAVDGTDPLETEFTPDLARKVVAGHFDGADRDAEQLAVLATGALAPESPYRVWLVPELGADFEPDHARQLGEAISSGPSGQPGVWELGMYAAVDIDRDGVDELVALAPSPAAPDRGVYRIGKRAGDDWQWLPAAGAGELSLPLYRYSGPTVGCLDPYHHPAVATCDARDFRTVLATPFDMPASNGRLRVCDLDGRPEDLELVLLSRLAGADEPDEPPKLFVYPLNGSLELTTQRFEPLQLDPPPNALFDFACVEADGQPGQEIAVLSGGGLRLWRWTASGGEPLGPPLPQSAGFHRVVAGDHDGDGLEDLVLGNEREVRVWHAVGEPSDEESTP